MSVHAENLIKALEGSNDKTVTMEREFFLELVRAYSELEQAISGGVKVEEFFGTSEYDYMREGVQLISMVKFLNSDIKGDVLVDAGELRSQQKENKNLKMQLTKARKANEKVNSQINMFRELRNGKCFENKVLSKYKVMMER